MVRRLLHAWARWRAERRKAYYFVPVGPENGRIRRVCPWAALLALERYCPAWERHCDELGAHDPAEMLNLRAGDVYFEDVRQAVERLADAGRVVFKMKPIGPDGSGNTETEALLAVLRFRFWMMRYLVETRALPVRPTPAGGGVLSRFVDPKKP